MSALHDRLQDLADAAPEGAAVPDDLWDRGVRRGRLRRAAAVAAVVTVVAAIAGTATLVRTDSPAPPAADVPFEELRLPTVVNTPGAWSDEEGPDGPLAALGLAERTRPVGLFDERHSMDLFGVSAVDGSAAWIDLPGTDIDDVGFVGWFALSPDGRWIGWSRHQQPRRPGGTAPLVGWAVMDTTSGEIRKLAVPDVPRLRAMLVADLAFSGDSQFLLTSYEEPDAPSRNGHQFVAWDVDDGAPTVLEEPGHYWLPSVGSAPADVVWSRGRTVHRVDPITGRRSSYSLPRHVVAASWAPDDTGFAYIGRRDAGGKGAWRLYAGSTLAAARNRPLELDVEPDQLLGWRDERHVVVGHFRSTVHVVDIVSGEVETLPMAGEGDPLNAPLLAADLWQHPLAEPAEPEGTSDPRTPYRWAGGALLVVLVGLTGFSALRRRRTRA